MRKILIAFSLFFLFHACGEKRSKIELIENNDMIYYSINELKHKPILKNDHNEIKKEIKSLFLRKVDSLEAQTFPISLLYDYFVGNDGRIEKLMPATKINRNREIIRSRDSNLPENYFTDIEPELVRILENIEFTSDSSLTKFKGLLFIVISKEFKEIVPVVSFGLETSDYSSGTDITNGSLEDVYFVLVEEAPDPIGGIEAIQKKITYPEVAKRAGIQGRVFVKAFIDEKGNVNKCEVIKGVHPALDSAAVDAVIKTKFTPGKQRGKPVKVQVSIPIVFALK
ncbi:MAG: energy transducer TonB [Bacteroidota bacterium]